MSVTEELEQRLAAGILKRITSALDKSKITEYNFKVQDNNFVADMNAKATLQGSQRMLALGQGIRARLGKNGDGKTIVEAFMFDRDHYSEEKVETWLSKHKDRIFESLHYVQMKAPAGSFEDTTCQIQMALDDSKIFAGFVRVEFVFSDHVIVCVLDNGDMYDVSYVNNGTNIEFGKSVKVTPEIVKEKIKEFNDRMARFRESNINIEDEKTRFKLKEGTFDKEKKEVVVVLIEAGINYNKKRYYPKKTIQEAAPLFAGLKMYLDHPTDAEEREKPERSIHDWLSTIKESWYEDGMALGRVHIHSPWLLENMADDVFRSEIGTSINASGRMHMGDIDGQHMQIMDSIIDPKSVDWVTEAGARGRVLQLQESQRLEKEKTEIKNMKTVAELKEANKPLYDQIVAEVTESMKGQNETKIAEAVDKAVAKALESLNEKSVKEAAATALKAKVTEIVNGSKLPEKARARFVETFIRENAEIKEADVDAKIKESIISEIKYLNEMGAGIKIDVVAGKGAGGVSADAQAKILEAAGLGEEKKD